MAFIIKTAKTIRNNWKKSTFATLLLSYGYNWTQEYFQIQDLMRVYCEQAAQLGNQTIPVSSDPRDITVILNPNANKRGASDEFEKYCAPLLHLAGICVNVIKTESEGHAKELINGISETDAIVVAGGDGTFSEVLTGLLRRTQENTKGLVPLGLLPLGRTNSTSSISLLCARPKTKLDRVKTLADATMAVVEETVRPINILKVEVLNNNEDEQSEEEGHSKPIYAASGIKWGAFRDAEAKKDSYWLYGGFRKYATYVFNGYKNSLSWNCVANLDYTPPCAGCSNCRHETVDQKKWFARYMKDQKPKFSHIVNPQCQFLSHKNITTVNFTLEVANNNQNEDSAPKFIVNIGPKKIDYFEFVKEGWRLEKGEGVKIEETIEGRTVEIRPAIQEGNKESSWFSIDNEAFEVKPVRVTLLPQAINVFCNKKHTNNTS